MHRNVVDQLLDDDGLADARAAEQADLAALQERLDQVDDLDAGLEHLLAGRLLVERRSLAMDRHVHLRVHRAELVHGLAKHVQHAAQRRAAHGNHDARAGIDRLHAAHHALGRDHRDAAHAALAQVLLHLDDHVQRRAAHRSRR